ncbi:peptidoglycan bridge formation glycyltransferase FemA/FemB family protein [Aureibaculum sp. A20]|uniref:Peptidoglycan bridge formation glycyltransferase FemA/FemB family protein n=1 Tax=Aureibaculum flavum TaxID=2795986 RepID=A0ABS0WKW6_9FLAO|nr:peptidoglycan bridge formation glycyltransferase FemA/FemB family protein [Aureibaculum flavum]MBJ2172611.1 peptidoglycan bridge formation glycyltransferase FemA/FemB family protein [Aureibaculum flavum]
MDYKFVSKFEDIDKNAWDDLIKKSQYGSVFQHSEMYEFWEKQDECDPFVFGIEENNNLLAVCQVVVQYNGTGLKKNFSKRAIIYGGAVISDTCEKDEVLTSLIKNMNKLLKSKAIYSEFRHAFLYKEFDKIFKENNYEYLPYQNFKISLTNEEEVFNNLTSEKRRQIRRSIKEGVEISYENTDFNIKGVYNIIKGIYLEKVKKPLPKLEFFNDLAKQKLGNIFALIYQGKVIGGGFLVFDNKCVYDWYRGGLDRDFKHQYPSTLAAWAVIKFGLDKQLSTFDFMGAGIKGEDYGVRNFKAQYGGELVEHGRYQKVLSPLKFKIAKLGLSILSKIR